MKQLKRRVFRERRRMAVFGSLAILSGYLLFVNTTSLVFGPSVAIFVFLGFAVLVPSLALALTLLFPSYRFAVELTGVVMLLFTLFALSFPGIVPGAIQHPEIVLLAGIAAVHGLASLIYGNWSDKFLRRKTHIERSLVLSDMPTPKEVWKALCPTPATLESFWNDEVVQIDAIPNEKDAFKLRYKFNDGKWMDQHIWFDQQKPGKSFRYDFQTCSDKRPGAETPKTFTVNLEKRNDGVTVHLRLERHNYPLRKSVVNWIDDHLGRTYDKAITVAETAEDWVLEPQF